MSNFLNENPYAQQIRAGMEGQTAGLISGLGIVGRQALSAGAGLITWVVGLMGWAVFPIYFSFFLMAETTSPKQLEGVLPFLKPETRKDIVYLVGEFVNIMVAFFRGQLVIASIQGLLFAVGFSIVGLKYGAVIGITLGFLNIVPYLGNIIGLGTALPIAFFQDGGGLGRVAAVLVVFALVQSDRRLLSDAQDHGRSHRAPPRGDHRRHLFLGYGAQRHLRDDPGHPADGFSRGFLASGARKIRSRVGLSAESRRRDTAGASIRIGLSITTRAVERPFVSAAGSGAGCPTRGCGARS